MKSEDRGRYKRIRDVEKRLEAGETVDPKTGRKIKLRKEDELVELREGDQLYLWLAGELEAAVPPQGVFPLPSEAREVFEHGLGRAAIRHPENQHLVLSVLEHYFAGRAEGYEVKFKKKDDGKPRPGARAGPRRRARARR